MQSVSSRIWTRVAVSTSYDDNHYTTGNYTTLLYNPSLEVMCLLLKYRCNLQDTFRSIGRTITMISGFDNSCVRYELVAQL